MTPQEFYSQYLPYAEKVSNQTGLDPRLVLAQAALETGYGKSAPNMNFFGIKSHGRKGGRTLQTSEFENGQMVNQPASFRGYESPDQSFQDYARFLKSNPRYEGVLSAEGIGNQISAMAKSGYATDPNYGAKLANIADKFDPSLPAIIASDAMRVLGKQPKGLLASSTMNTTESEMVPEQKPKGLLGGLFSDPDKRARLAMALEGMTLNPNQGMMASLQGGIDQRGEDRKEAAAEAKKLAQTNKSLEFLASQPGGEDYVRLAEAAGVPTAMKAYLDNKKAPKSTTAEDKIARLKSTGMSDDLAIGIVDGRYVVKTNDITGETFVFDVATGRKLFDATGTSNNQVLVGETAPIPDEGSLAGLDPTKALALTGYANSWLNAAADTFGQKLPAPEAAKASAAMRSLATRTIALADTEFAGKPTNFLRERVEQNFSINPDQISMGPRVALERSNVIIDMLQETVDGAKAVIAGGTATVDAKKSAMDSLPKSEALLRDYISLRDALNSNLSNGNNPAQIPKDVMTIYEQYTSEAN
jgi:hypothetical protein